MKNPLALILYYTRDNRYSFNVLLGALERSSLEGLDVYILEDEDKLLSGLNELINKYKNVIVAFSFLTPQLWDIHKTVGLIRDRFKDRILLIAGGPHPTGDPVGTLEMGFDIVVRGEGEETFIELLDKIIRDESYSEVKGIGFIGEGKRYRFTGYREFIDLDKYLPFSITYGRFNPIEISRGCPFACYFCQTPRIFGTTPRHRSIDKILDCVRVMKDKGLTDIRFISPSIFSYGSLDGRDLRLDLLEELFKGIRGIIGANGRIFIGTFPSEVRPEQVREETVDLILRYGDNKSITIGAQSGSDRILELSHRGHRVSDIYNAVSLAKRFGLHVNVDFIFGLPYENEEDIEETVRVIEDLVSLGARIHAHTFLPLPQVPFANFYPKGISVGYKKMINRLLPKGVVFGYWREQEKLAYNIYRYLISREI